MNLGKDHPVVVVTGASRGIGRAIALSFGSLHWRVVVNFKERKEQAEEVVKEIESGGGIAMALQADVSVQYGARVLIERTTKEWGRIDVLVNNAGWVLERPTLILDMIEHDWTGVLLGNLNSCFFCSQEAGRVMKRQGYGSIVNISSVLAYESSVGEAPYGVAKAGICSLTRTLARELGKYKIRVNAVAPGLIDTDMTKGISEEFRKMVIGETCLKRIGNPQEIADAVIFCAITASYMTGETIRVDGGLV